MTTVYEERFTVKNTECDRYGRLRPAMLLSFCQEVAGKHFEVLYGNEALAQRGLFWAVIRQRAAITRLPGPGETVTLKTWPMPTTKVAFPRSTVAVDGEGKELFRVISLWVLMDMDKRSMVLPGRSGIALEGLLTGNELAAPGSLAARPLAGQELRPVRFSDLDTNGHMNNTRFLDWTDDLLPSAFHAGHPAREFTVCYLTEAREGEALALEFELLEGPQLRVDAHREKTAAPGRRERVFSAQVVY